MVCIKKSQPLKEDQILIGTIFNSSLGTVPGRSAKSVTGGLLSLSRQGRGVVSSVSSAEGQVPCGGWACKPGEGGPLCALWGRGLYACGGAAVCPMRGSGCPTVGSPYVPGWRGMCLRRRTWAYHNRGDHVSHGVGAMCPMGRDSVSCGGACVPWGRCCISHGGGLCVPWWGACDVGFKA